MWLLNVGILLTIQSMTVFGQEWKERYVGCFHDPHYSGLRHPGQYVDTVKRCMDVCRDKKFTYAGLQNIYPPYACYCGNRYLQPKISRGCKIQCTKGQGTCGGHHTNAVYRTGFEMKYTRIDGYRGCFMLRNPPTPMEVHTVDECLVHCSNQKTKYAMIHNGNKCYCSMSYDLNWENKECDKNCKYGRGECGGWYAMSVYEVGDFFKQEYSTGAYYSEYNTNWEGDLIPVTRGHTPTSRENAGQQQDESQNRQEESENRQEESENREDASPKCTCVNRSGGIEPTSVDAYGRCTCRKDAEQPRGEGRRDQAELAPGLVVPESHEEEAGQDQVDPESPKAEPEPLEDLSWSKLLPKHFGCARSIGESPKRIGPLRTPQECVKKCNYYKYRYAAIKRGYECFCSNEYVYAEEKKCYIKCTNKKFYCGGDDAYSTYIAEDLVTPHDMCPHL